ncbi:arrestin domain-containing protein 17-like [Prorops nasuta]|uniref:arrestin domain-containing protein 17-like n=1 Tax=Prorops nasuta TaxID=863751 RepID=UPI0034D000C7
MGLQEFTIVFDNQMATYYPGQTVSGNVVLTLNAIKKVRGISIKIKGEANTKWSSDKREMDERGNYETETETVRGYENYFETKYYLVGSASGVEIEIQQGEHRFPFSCALPATLPSSFESDYGHIRYTVKATLDRPWKFDQDVKAAFTIVDPLDLNHIPSAFEPVNEEMSKTFCCLCCGSPPLTVNYSLPVRGYVPGQTMPIKVNVENSSGVRVIELKLKLYKVVTYRAAIPRFDTKVEEITVKQVSRGPIDGNETMEYEQGLDIPPLPPSNLANCGIIDLSYVLEVRAAVEGWYHEDLKESTGIYIGSIPLVNYQRPSAPPIDPSYPIKANAPYPTSPDPAPNYSPPVPQPPTSNLYPDLPPPSYMEATDPARNLRERGESENVIGLTNIFAPRYPVYNFTAPK